MANYSADAASAYADLLDAGAAVTFDTSTLGTHDPATGRITGASSGSVSGAAMADEPTGAEVERYRANGLILDRVVTLIFAPRTYGDLPRLGATVVWAGETFKVVDRAPFAPSGSTIIARIGIAR